MTIVVVPAAFEASVNAVIAAGYAGLALVRGEFPRSTAGDYPVITGAVLVAGMNGAASHNSVEVPAVDTVVAAAAVVVVVVA